MNGSRPRCVADETLHANDDLNLAYLTAPDAMPDATTGDAPTTGAEHQPSGYRAEQETPTRYRTSTVMVLLAVLSLLALTFTLFTSLGGEESSGTEAAQEEEGSAEQADAPGTEPADAQRFDSASTRPSADVAEALRAYNEDTTRGEAGRGNAGTAPAGRGEERNPYGRPSRPSRAAPQRERQVQEAERGRKEALQQALAAEARSEARAPRFSPTGPAPRSTGNEQGGRAGPDETDPYGRPASASGAPDRTIRGPEILPGGSVKPAGGPDGSPYGRAAGAGTPLRTNGAEPTDNERFLANVRAEGSGRNQMTRVQGPLPPFTLAKGTLIPITLESAASSDLPGSIIARTMADVYDRTKQHVLVPAGSEIVTDYGQPSAIGQSRLLIAATRLTLPDGRFVNFQDVQATDPSGTAGLRDQKDRYLLARFGAVGALAILGTAVNIATFDEAGYYGGVSAGRRDTTENGEVVIYPPVPGGYGRPSFRGAVGQSFAGQVNKVLGELLERAVDRKPTLKLRPGLRGRLLLGQDIDMDRPYYEGGSDLGRIEAAAQRRAAAQAARRHQE